MVALVLVAPLGASAGKLFVDFDFTGSSVTILGGFISVPPDGTITSGSGTIAVQAPGLLTPLAGAARIQNLGFAGTFAKNDFGVNIAGAVGASQPSNANGTLSPALDHLDFDPFQMNFTGFASCTSVGPGCGVLSLPATFNGPQVLTIMSLAVGGLSISGGAFVNGTFDITLNGFTGVLNLVGNEVSRTWVPEPDTFGMLGLGLAGLAVSRRHLRR